MELLKKVGDFSKITQVREDEVTELEERLKAISFQLSEVDQQMQESRKADIKKRLRGLNLDRML